jgi:hypothetical protein
MVRDTRTKSKIVLFAMAFLLFAASPLAGHHTQRSPGKQTGPNTSVLATSSFRQGGLVDCYNKTGCSNAASTNSSLRLATTQAEALSAAADPQPIPFELGYGPSGMSLVENGVPVYTAQPIPFELGYGPSGMSPVGDGVPVYTAGDSLWATSGYNQSVTVSLVSASAQLVDTKSLDPEAIIPLYSFGTGDIPGVWNITVGAPDGNVVVPIHLVNTKGQGVGIESTSYSLQGGTLSISGNASLGFSYAQEVCALSNDSMNKMSFQLPQNLGQGNVTISGAGNQFAVATARTINSPFAFSFELDYPYAFNAVGTNTLVTSNLRAAESQPILVNSSAKSITSLQWNFPPRDGRYEIKSFFQSATGLIASEGRILMINGSWASLDSCTNNPLVSQNFALEDSVVSGPSHWPKSIYLMYRIFGVEGVASAPVSAGLSGVSFLASTWGVPLQDVKVEVAPDPRILQVSEQANSVYVLASQYPFPLNFSVAVGGSQAASGSLTIESPYTLTNSSVSVGRLTVFVIGDGSAEAVARVIGTTGGNITRLVNDSQASSFYLPAGSYRITASQGFNSLSTTVTLADGSDSTVKLDIRTFQSLQVALALTAVIGAVSYLVYRAVGPRNPKSSVASSPHDQGSERQQDNRTVK